MQREFFCSGESCTGIRRASLDRAPRPVVWLSVTPRAFTTPLARVRVLVFRTSVVWLCTGNKIYRARKKKGGVCTATSTRNKRPAEVVMADSTQHWFERNRPPRVQITYDVEIGNATEKKELPLVVGILAD